KRGSHSCRYILPFPLPGGPKSDKRCHYINGAYLGFDAIPEKWVKKIEKLKYLDDLAKGHIMGYLGKVVFTQIKTFGRKFVKAKNISRNSELSKV
ncbi:hypothetical protein KAT51_00070, partial [bacterium]|nr:hypothetical protein [bacterium]